VEGSSDLHRDFPPNGTGKIFKPALSFSGKRKSGKPSNLFSRMKEFPFEGLDDAMIKSLAKI